MKIFTKLIVAVILLCFAFSTTNVFAWTTGTHTTIIDKAMNILRNDGKNQVVSFYNSYLSEIKNGAIAPDNDGDVDNGSGLHYYIVRDRTSGGLLSSSSTGEYSMNRTGEYLKSARTILEENYTMAVTMYLSYLRTGNQSFRAKAMDFLGRAIHGLSDIGTPVHSLEYVMNGSTSIHYRFEEIANNKKDVYYGTSCPQSLYDYYKNDSDFIWEANRLASTSSAEYSLLLSGSNSDLALAASNSLPTTEYHVAALLNKFYYDVTSNTNPKGLVSGKTYYIVSRKSGKYMTLKNKATSSGTQIVQYTHNSSYADYQKFTVVANTDGTISFRPTAATSLYLSVNLLNSLKTKNSITSAAKFKIAHSEGGYYYITSDDSYNKVLRVCSPFMDNNSNIGQYDFNADSLNHYWMFVEVS